MKEKNIGSSFDGWLRDEGLYQEVTATEIKRVLARHVEGAMNRARKTSECIRFAYSENGSRIVSPSIA
jgi:hypothetical protein